MSKPTIHHSPQWFRERIATLEAQKASIWDQYQAAEAQLESINKAMTDREYVKEKLEARVKELEQTVDAYNNRLRAEESGHKACAARVKELEGEVAGWQQNYADQMRNPKQRQAYLAQLEKRKERA